MATSSSTKAMPRKRSEPAKLEGQLHLYASGTYSYSSMTRAAVLGLEDGSTWWGEAFGDGSPASGEVVFNTAMTGYQEIASDASYNGQIVVLTYPLIGNYGTFERAAESRRPWVEAIIVRELVASCREGTIDFDVYLRSFGVPGLAGIDTRALVRRLRAKGTLRGAILQVPPARAIPPRSRRSPRRLARCSTPRWRVERSTRCRSWASASDISSSDGRSVRRPRAYPSDITARTIPCRTSGREPWSSQARTTNSRSTSIRSLLTPTSSSRRETSTMGRSRV